MKKLKKMNYKQIIQKGLEICSKVYPNNLQIKLNWELNYKSMNKKLKEVNT